MIRYEGAQNIAAFMMETVVGTNGLLIPPDGYLQGVREICDRHGILLIADEVMSGFGRTGKWFAVDHWKVVPDIITMAKGITSAYVPLGAVGLRPQLVKAFQERAFPGGLTYNSHPLACATALATIARLRGRGPARERRADGQGPARAACVELEKKHPSVGRDALDRPLRHRRAGAQPQDASSRWRPTTAPRTRWRRSAASSARTASTRSCAGTRSSRTRRSRSREAQLDEGLSVIDKALEITDRAVKD